MVGTGIRPQSSHKDPKIKEAIQDLWQGWTEEADVQGNLDFYGLQALVIRSMVEGGEVLARFRNRLPQDGLIVPLQLQILEPEHLPYEDNRTLDNGRVVAGGIELDQFERKAAYHLLKRHPGSSISFENSFDTVRVPASEIMHVFKVLRPGQIRGEPWLSQIIVKMHDLDKYDDAEVLRQQLQAMYMAFVTKKEQGNGPHDEDEDDLEFEMVPGNVVTLREGEEITFSDPPGTNPGYKTFMKTQLMIIAQGFGITYEQLSGDLEGVNFSSIRAGLLESRRMTEQWRQNTITHQFCRPVWSRWMDQAFLAGKLDLPGYKNPLIRRKHQEVKWIPQSWKWVDPLKELNAIVIQIRAGLMSREQAARESGYELEVIDREIAIGNKNADELKLIYDSDPRKMTKSGARQKEETDKKVAV